MTEATKAMVEAAEALSAMLRHSCVADAAPEDKDPEDHDAERKARKVLDALAAAKAVEGEAGNIVRYAERLATTLWEKHWKRDAPEWKPLVGNLIGLLTQIDNATAGLIRPEAGNIGTDTDAAGASVARDSMVRHMLAPIRGCVTAEQYQECIRRCLNAVQLAGEKIRSLASQVETLRADDLKRRT